MLDEIPSWIKFEGSIPKNAIVAGDYLGQRTFIGRAHHNGSLTPGMVLNHENAIVCIIPWGCVWNVKEDFEILVGPKSSETNWVNSTDGNVPLNAFRGGHSEQGEVIYIGRYMHENCLVVGKIQPSHRVCYIAYATQELHADTYEVLVI